MMEGKIHKTTNPFSIQEYDGAKTCWECPSFSIVVLCYQNTDSLWDMLDSICQQDYPNIELIVSDDGSNDFDAQAVKQYIEENKRENITSVIVRQNPENMGTVRHIHTVLAQVQSEYLAFSAADDRFYGKTVISAYVKAFTENPDRGWIVARSRITSANYKNTIYTTPTERDMPYFQQGDPIRLYSRWSRRGIAIPCSMAFRKSAIEAVGGIDLNFRFLEDWPLVLKLLRNGHMPIFLNQVTAIHSAGGVTNTNVFGTGVRKEFLEDKKRILKMEPAAHKDLLTPEDRKAYRQYMREIMGRQYFFGVELPENQGKLRKIWLMLKKPIRAVWYAEALFRKKRPGIQIKKMALVSQILLIISLLIEANCEASRWAGFFGILSLAYGLLGVLLLLLSLFCAAMVLYCRHVDKLRKELVN